MTDTPPPGPASAARRLAAELRGLRRRTGLSMAALAERTPYSKSSWERYLNGKALIPRQAVEALCRMADEPPGRLVALWELADLEWSGRAGSAPRPVAEGPSGRQEDGRGDAYVPEDRAGRGAAGRRWGSPPVRSWGRRRWLAVGVGACAIAAGTAVWAVSLPDAGIPQPAGQARTAAPATGCHAQGCMGQEPGTMGCGGLGQVQRLGSQHRTATGARVEIRYSPACTAAWARMWHTKVGDALEMSAPGGKPERAETTDRLDAQGTVRTHMVDARDLTGLRACFEPVGGGEECFHG